MLMMLQGCKDYSMDMILIKNQQRDEFINDYLVNTGLFTADGAYHGVWTAAHGGRGFKSDPLNTKYACDFRDREEL